MRRKTTAHIAGFPVSYSTYTNHGCRCAGCSEKNTLYMRDARSRIPKINQDHAARGRALTRLKANHVAEFRRLLDEERAH
jgi:hypothetical protein